MKNSLSLLFVSFVLASCGQQSQPLAETSAISASSSKNYVATIIDDANQAAFTKDCANKIAAVKGVKVTAVMDVVGVVSFTASKTASGLVEKLSCVQAVEAEQIITTQPTPTSINYNAVVKDGKDQTAYTKACAAKVKAIKGVVVTQVLGVTGIISFTSTEKLSKKVEKLDCISSIEVEQTVDPLPSTGVGN